VIRPNGGDTANAGQGSVARSYTVRATNMLLFSSDKFAGFGVNAMYIQDGNNATQATTAKATTGGNTNFSGWGLSADYTWQKLYATAAYQSLKQETTANGTSFGSAFPGTSTLGSNVNTNDNSWYLAATYDFGILKGYINYVNQKLSSTLNSSNYYQRSGQQIGVRSYITPVVEGWASIGNGRVNLNSSSVSGSSAPTTNFNAWQLGSNYYLSKRTNLYAIYGQTIGSGNISASGTAGSGYALGLRHTF
jgi:predicted porin